MSRLRSALLAVLLGAPAAASAQTEPPRDTIVIGRFEPPRDTLRLEAEPDTLAADSTPRRPSRWGAPFAVESRGRAVARRSRGEVVWVDRAEPAPVEPSRVDSADQQVVLEDAPAPARADSSPRRPPADSARPARDSTPRAPAGRPRTHTVAAGETLFGIARRYGVTTAQLRVLNPSVDAEELEVGTVLRLPATARAPGGAAPRTPARPTPARPAAAARRTHTVVRGETLFGIARRYNVTVDAIMRANRMERDQVQVGQTLVIPPQGR